MDWLLWHSYISLFFPPSSTYSSVHDPTPPYRTGSARAPQWLFFLLAFFSFYKKLH